MKKGRIEMPCTDNSEKTVNQSKYLRISLLALFFSVLVIVLTIGFSVGSVKTGAEKQITDADINAQKDKIESNQDKIKEYESKIESLKDSIDNALDLKEELDKQIAVMEETIADTDLLIEQYGKLINEKEKQINERQGDVSAEYGNLLERLRISYINGTRNYLELMVSSEDLSDFLTRAENLGSLLTYEQKLMSRLETEISNLDDMKAALEEKKREYNELAAEQEGTKKKLEKSLSEAETLISKLQKDEKTAEKLRQEAEKADKAFEKELQELIKKQQEQESAYVGGKFLWPLPNSCKIITDVVGKRASDGSYSSDHKGLDIAASRNTDIYAVNDGTVITATYAKGLGYYLVIDHGGGKTTLYGHCNKLIAKKGQKVKQGQVIAKVGMSGVATGYHLHLEVRINGVAVEPLKTELLVMKINGKLVDPYKNNLLKYQGCKKP